MVSSDTLPKTTCICFYNTNLINIENIAINSFFGVFPNYEGRIFGRNGRQQGNMFCYELYVTAADLDYSKLIPYGYELSHEIPSFNAIFATTVIENDELRINAAWDYLYSEWLQNSMFEYTGEPYYEEYLVKNGKLTKLKLYLPIQKRADDVKITLITNPCLCFVVVEANGYNAELNASTAVIDYMKQHYLHIIKSFKEFYVQKNLDTCVCGVHVSAEFWVDDSENIKSITTEHNNYLMLESCVMGDYCRYAELLATFAKENGMRIDKQGIFAVYDVRNSYKNARIKMYCPVKVHIK